MAPFSSLNKDCIEKIISLTSPVDACRTEAVSPAFKSAAEDNTVWECFLPPGYEEMISVWECLLPPDYKEKTSWKKKLYFLLCDAWLVLDDGKLFFKLGQSSGKKSYIVPARELQITWGAAPEHWDWKPFDPESSRFNEVAVLLKVSWLDIRTEISSKWLSPNTNYAAYLVFKLTNDPIMLHIPTRAVVRKTTEVEENVRTVYIVRPNQKGLRKHQLARRRKDGWREIELGEVFVPKEDIFDVHCAIYEHENQYWKRGLIVLGIEVRPKE